MGVHWSQAASTERQKTEREWREGQKTATPEPTPPRVGREGSVPLGNVSSSSGIRRASHVRMQCTGPEQVMEWF